MIYLSFNACSNVSVMYSSVDKQEALPAPMDYLCLQGGFVYLKTLKWMHIFMYLENEMEMTLSSGSLRYQKQEMCSL